MPKEHVKALKEATKDLKIESNLLERKPEHKKKIHCPLCCKAIDDWHTEFVDRISLVCEDCDIRFGIEKLSPY